jgi:hypothetical protein
LLEGKIFYSLREAQIVIESWRRHFNTVRPHASLGYRPPAPEVLVPRQPAGPASRGAKASPELTFHKDHSVGAGHFRCGRGRQAGSGRI